MSVCQNSSLATCTVNQGCWAGMLLVILWNDFASDLCDLSSEVHRCDRDVTYRDLEGFFHQHLGGSGIPTSARLDEPARLYADSGLADSPAQYAQSTPGRTSGSDCDYRECAWSWMESWYITSYMGKKRQMHSWSPPPSCYVVTCCDMLWHVVTLWNLAVPAEKSGEDG